MKTYGLRTVQQGGDRKDAKRAQEHEKNVLAAGIKIFSSHIHRILMQAILQKYDILDCVDVIDLGRSPPTVEVMLASVFLSDRMHGSTSDSGLLDRSKQIIEQNSQDGSLTLAIFFAGEIFLKLIPARGDGKVSWRGMQASLEETLKAATDHLQQHPDELERELRDLRLVKTA